MARKHMKIFNVAHGWCHKIADTPIPHGAFYGRDSVSYWYCINKELYPLDTPTLEMYRFDTRSEEWVLLIEQSETVKIIVELATKDDWNMPIEYPKYKGIHNVANTAASMHSKSYQTIPGKTTFQELQLAHEKRHNTVLNQPNDIWESIAPMSYADKFGSKNLNSEKGQYTQNSKPYIVREDYRKYY